MIQIDLSGPQGNTFALLGLAKNWAKQLDLNWDEIRAEVLSGDYGNAVKTMQKHFGHVAEFNGEDTEPLNRTL